MAKKQNSLERFWKELKRRKVIHVITVYAATAFVILELVNMVARPLQLPEWTEAFVIVLLCIGFVISVVVSWIYDVTPAGVRKTKPVKDLAHDDHRLHEASSGWKIATYISAVMIIGLLAFNFVSRRNLHSNISRLEKSIAVLPLVYLSENPDKEYLANGVLDAITGHLSIIEGLRVMPRTSVEQYRENKKSAKQIGKELDVSYLIEGSFLLVNEQAKIAIQLVVAEEGKHIFFKEYDRNYRDIFAVQSEVAQTIAREIEVAITPEEKQMIEEIPTTNLTAYDFYQRGREKHMQFWLNSTNVKALEVAISYYKLALMNDSTFAQAYTGLAMARMNSYWRDAYTRLTFSEKELKIVNDSILSLVDKALTYNKNLDEAYFVKGKCEADDNQAIKSYRRALEINPNNSWAYANIAFILFYSKEDVLAGFKNMIKAIELEKGPFLPDLLFSLGQWYESFGFITNALDIYNQKFQLTKDTLQFYRDMSGPYYVEKNWKESIRWAKKIFGKDPKNIWAHQQLEGIYSFIGNHDSSAYYLKNLVEIDSLSYEGKFYKGKLLWISGNYKEAKVVFDKISEFSQKLLQSEIEADWNAYTLLKIYLMEGDQNKAIEYLKRISRIAKSEMWFIITMEIDPVFKNLRSNPEFQEILRDAKSNWQTEHDRINAWLKENNLLKN